MTPTPGSNPFISTVEAFASRLRVAAGHRRPIVPLTQLHPDLSAEEAYLIQQAGVDHLIARAEAPTKGTSLKAPLLAAVFLFAGFTALCVGLLRVFTRRGFVTPASTGRTLDMPVLAVAPVKGR